MSGCERTVLVTEDSAGTRYVSVFEGQTGAIAFYREDVDLLTRERRQRLIWFRPEPMKPPVESQ